MGPRRRFRIAAGLSATALVAFVVWMVGVFGGGFVTTAVDDLGEFVAALTAAAASWWAARRYPDDRRGWLLLSASAFAWGAGEAVWSWYELAQGVEVPFPSLADLGFLVSVPLAAAAMLSFRSGPSTGASRARAVLDGCILAGSLLLVSWVTVLGPLSRTSAGNAWAQVIGLAYPVGDVIVIAIVIAVLARARYGWRTSLVLIAGGLVALAVADSAFAYFTAVDSSSIPHLVGAGWVAGFLLVALGALHPGAGGSTAEERAGRLSALQVVLPYVPVGVAAAVVVGRQLSGSRYDSFLFWNGAAVVALVVSRQLLMLVENLRLTRRLETTVTELRAREEELQHRVFHDDLTGLANLALFRDRVDHALARQRRQAASMAVLLIDLDDFKVVNDTLGHAAGDQVLTAAAERLRASVREGDTIARVGGDEFAVLVDGGGREEGVQVAERAIESLREAFSMGGRSVVVRASVGVATSDLTEDTSDRLLQDADLALYAAKEQGKDRHEVFEAAMRKVATDRLELKAHLAAALDGDEIVAHYQPIVEVVTGRIIGVEALARWEHPERGLIMPGAFIPLAEETAAIVPIGRRILRQACGQVRVWQERYAERGPITLNVNLSARQLLSESLVVDVRAALEGAALDPAQLVLEITESALVKNTSAAITRLHQLRALGVRLAIDDFGTGYSSLSYLRRLPVDVLKIDRSFISDLSSKGGSVLVEAILRLAESLGIEAVAEGVETDHQRVMLARLGCRLAQGYLFGPPTEPDAFARRLAAETPPVRVG